MPWTVAGAGEAATAADGPAVGALGPVAAAALGVEVSTGGVELRRTRGR